MHLTKKYGTVTYPFAYRSCRKRVNRATAPPPLMAADDDVSDDSDEEAEPGFLAGIGASLVQGIRRLFSDEEDEGDLASDSANVSGEEEGAGHDGKKGKRAMRTSKTTVERRKQVKEDAGDMDSWTEETLGRFNITELRHLMHAYSQSIGGSRSKLPSLHSQLALLLFHRSKRLSSSR